MSLHQLLECGAIAKEHPKLLAVYEMAKRRLSIDDDDDIREKLFAIVDWYEDHSSESYSNFSGIKNQLLEPVADSLEPVADSFVWPSTQIFQSTTSLADGVFQIDQGVLKMFGYTVGTRGLAEVKRRLILESLYQGQQSSLRGHPQEFEWGEPNSSARLQKLANTIAALTRNAKRKRRSPIAAIRDWENDLEFLKSNYYDGVYDFYWPTTDA